MNKKQSALLGKTADILEKLAEKCGGQGGKPGPCPTGRSRKPASTSKPPGSRKPTSSHEDELKASQDRAGKVGGREVEVDIGGKAVKSMTVFYKPDTTLGGSRTSRSVLLGDHTTYAGKKGNVRQIDPAGKHIILQTSSGYEKIGIRSAEEDWAALEKATS